jgi:hypothetical protein
MTTPSRRLWLIAAYVCVITAGLSAVASAKAEPAIIAKARSFVGTEAALNAVKSVHFVGTLTKSDPADPTKQLRAALELFFQAPEQHRIQVISEKNIEVTALDGYDGWHRIQDNADSSKWSQTLLGADQIKRLRAETWESTGFYRGIERHGGSIEDQGPVVTDGIACRKLAFIYSQNIIFYRFIDSATGRLVRSETESGNSQRELGEIVASGVRFPKTIVSTNKSGTGQIETLTLNFDKITVNEAMPASLFAVPDLKVK